MSNATQRNGDDMTTVKGKIILQDGNRIGKIVGCRDRDKEGAIHTSFAILLDNGNRIELDHYSYFRDVVKHIQHILES